MEQYRCTKETDIATLVADVKAIKISQTEMKDLVIVVTKLVEQLSVTQQDVKSIKYDVQTLKDKPLGFVNKILYVALGVLVTYMVNKMLGVI